MSKLYCVPAGTLFDKAKKSKILKVADFQDFFFFKESAKQGEKKQLR